MLTKVLLLGSEIAALVNSRFAISDLTFEKLVKKDKIDTGFYHVDIKHIDKGTNVQASVTVILIDYELQRKAIWNDLSECEERLRIGL